MDREIVLYSISLRIPSPNGHVVLKTAELGKMLGVSQQSASRYLRALEDAGLVTRQVTGAGQRITITSEGLATLRDMHLNLSDFFKGVPLVLTGKIITGMGQGAYYVGQYSEKIKKKLGFRPFPGTLNVKLDRNISSLLKYTSGEIGAFESQNRKFGGIRLAEVTLCKGKKSLRCHLVIPERTHHRDEIEIITEENLRKRLKLLDNDVVSVKFT